MKGIKGFQKGHPNYNKGKSIKSTCDECKSKIEIKPSALKWKKHFCNHKCYAKNMIGHKMSKNNRLALIKAHTGLACSTEKKNKISFANSGEKNGMWKEDSERNVKKRIRQRDNFICLLCGLHQEKNGNSLDVHHIDYDQSNNLIQNMISLCHICHAKTNKSKREFWTQHFHLILNDKYGYKYLDNKILIELNDRKSQ